jgi:hypothetical protein
MNEEGLAFGLNSSDTLDNGMVVDVLAHIASLSSASLVGRGMPGGMMTRSMLAEASTVDEGVAFLASIDRGFGWNIALADREGGMLAVESDANILGDPDGGLYAYGPSDLPEDPASLGSLGPDDLRLTCHYVANADDFDLSFIRPQRFWSFFYFRSLRAYYLLGDRMRPSLGSLDVPAMIEIMRDPDLVDPRDSMSAVVFEPAARRLHVAMGQVPATDGDFLPFELEAFFGSGGDR